MKIKIGSFFLILSCISTCSFAQIKEKIEVDRIFTEWNKSNVPGGALGVVKDGKLVYANGYGIADLEHDVKITPSTVFYIGSVSKQFVTFCVLLLEEQGKLNLDDPIQKYFPDFPCTRVH
jgi:CubicO group peptidase (beta-lactamase class C family)